MAGITIALIISTHVNDINRLYFANMVGSGLGCVLMLVLLSPLTASKLLFLLSSLAALSSFMLTYSTDKRISNYALLACLILVLPVIKGADRVIPIKPASSKMLAISLKAKGARIEYTRWHPLYRIDVVSADEGTHVATFDPGYMIKNISLDGDANTWIYKGSNLDSLREIYGTKMLTNFYQAPFVIKEKPKVLIIGPGGGNEIRAAQYHQARDIVGVELHPLIVDLVRNKYSDFVGNIYQKPNTRIYVGEGRSFIKRCGEKFDVIQLSGVDTWSGLRLWCLCLIRELPLYCRGNEGLYLSS